MDAFEILGIKQNPKSQSELCRLYKRSAKLQAYYWQKSRREDSKRVKWAFDKVKKDSGLELPEKRKPEDLPSVEAPPPDASGEGAGGESAGAGVEGGGGGRKRKAPTDPEQRREAIREKLLARRQAVETGADDKAKRQDVIKERLVAKRIIKKVVVKAEDECKKGMVEFLSASNGDADSERNRLCLLCPVSIERIKTASRGTKCQHLQCFDLEAFLMSKGKTCPVCDLPLEPPADVFVDSYITKAISSVADDTVNEISFDQSGDWRIIEAQASSPEASEDEDEQGIGGIDAMFMATPLPPATPFSPEPDAEKEDEDDGEAARRLEVEAAAAKAASSAAAAAALAKRAEGLRAAIAAAKQAEEEKKMQALLKFIPKGRKDAKPKVEAAKPAAIAEADDDSESRQGMEDDTSYVVVELSKPLGIVFQANPPPVSEGACIRSFDEGGAAAVHGRLRVGDQLVGIAGTCVMGQDVDRCINLIVASRGKTVKVTFFRGQAKHLYGKGKPSDAWIQDLLRGVNVGSCRPSPPLDRRSAAGAAKRKMALSGGDEASDEETEEAFEDDAAGLPASVAQSIRGEGLDADLLRCGRALAVAGAASEKLPGAVLRACIDGNLGEWEEMEGKDAWRRAAARRLAEALGGER